MNSLIRKKSVVVRYRGFILLELIIVLLVITLLLAILIPLVITYIDDAKEDAELSEVRAIKTALQTIIINDQVNDNIDEFVVYLSHDNKGLSKEGIKEVERLLEMSVGHVEHINIDDDIIQEFTYFTVNGSKIKYENGNFNVEYIY